MGAHIEEKGGVTVITKQTGVPFRILQLTDIHIGGGFLSRKKDALACDAVRRIVEAADADMVAVTGDIAYPVPPFSGTRNNLKASRMFGEVMTSLGVPWAMVFGNHDSESYAKYTKEEIADYYESLSGCLFKKGAEGITGCGNYHMELRNEDGTLNNLLMFLDSNAYLTNSFFSGFDVIHDDQTDWYENTVRSYAQGESIPRSLAFFHIPPKEFKEGWDKCYRGSGEAQYHCGFVLEKDNYFGYPKTKEGDFFRRMTELGSCNGMFVGHDHMNTLSITYRGIRMTYGMSIDYLAYSKLLGAIPTAKRHTQRGGTIIDIYDDGTFDVIMMPLDDIEQGIAFNKIK